jgi:hypothetical protein
METKDNKENKDGLLDAIKNVLREKDAQKSTPIFVSLLVIGVFIKLTLSYGLNSTDGSTGEANALIWGYGITVFSLLGIIFVNIKKGSDDWNALQRLPWALLLTIVLLMWMIALNVKYFTAINKKAVPPEYFLWSYYSSILVICLIFFAVIQYLQKGTGNEQLATYTAIFAFFNVLLVGIQQIVLDCFYVDG